jgi:hypothetical protein
MGLLKVSARSVRAKVSWPRLAAGSTQSRMTQLRHRGAKMIEWPRPQKSAVGIHRGCPRHERLASLMLAPIRAISSWALNGFTR